MLTILHTLESPVIESLGWALVHFLWQATLLAVLLVVVLPVLRKASSRVKYVIQCSMLLAMAACPAMTWWWIASTMKPNAVIAVSHVEPVLPNDLKSEHVEPVLEPMVTGAMGLDGPIDASSIMLAPAPAMSAVASLPDQVEVLRPDQAVSWNKRLRSRMAPILPWFVGAWLLGVLVLSLRLLVGWRIVQRLKRLAVTPADAAWQLRLKALAARLRVTHTVQLVESALIEVPTVIGWIRPMILLPVSLLTSLTTQQLEAVLAHELAHIRRHDYLVNLFQTAIETLLFYHPAVWWLSRMIRAEREHCCDDLALSLCDNPVTYVSALAAMEELRASPTLTLAATGGSLLNRIRRIALGPTHDSRRSIWWGASLIALTTLVALGLTTYIASHATDDVRLPSQQAPSDSTMDTKADQKPGSASSDSPTKTTLPDGLEFLKPYPKLHGLSLDMTEPQFLEIVKQQELKTRKTVDGKKVTHHIALGDGHSLVVMFDKDGKCGSIQRVRGEDKNPDEKLQPQVSIQDVVRGVDFSKVKVHGHDEESLRQLPDLHVPDPKNPGALKSPKNVFPMPLGEHTWLMFPAGSGRFYIEHRPDGTPQSELIYGPIDGDPFEVLKLDDLFRERLKPGANEGDPRYRLTLMLHTGDPQLIRRAWRLVEPELAPQSTDDEKGPPDGEPAARYSDRDEWRGNRLESLERVREALRDEAETFRKPELSDVATQIRETVAAVEAVIDAINDSVPDESYQSATYLQPKIQAKLPDALWGKPVSGLRLGLVPTNSGPAGADWNTLPADAGLPTLIIARPGEPLHYLLMVENVSDQEIKFSGYTTGEDIARSIEIPDRHGKPVMYDSLHTTIPHTINHWRLKPGERKLFTMPAVYFHPATPNMSHRGLGYHATVPDGRYSVRCSYYFGGLDKERHRHVAGRSPWIGKLTTGSQTITFGDGGADTTSNAATATPAVGLEFLKPYPKLHGLSLDMAEPQFLKIVKQQELKTRKTVEGDKVTHHVMLGDGHTLIVMFDKDAKCNGIQRVRDEGAADETISLAEAVREFNAESKRLGRGLNQPALTEEEIITVIKRDKRQRGDPWSLNKEEIAAFKAVAESQRLPKGARLDVHTEDRAETFLLKQLWQVRLMLPAIGHDGLVGLTIRNTMIADEKIDPKLVAWGKPDAEGLSLGAYLSPKKAQYTLGERVRLRLFVRNDGQQPVNGLTFYRTSHPMPDDFTVMDDKGAKVGVHIGHEDWDHPWVSGATGGGLAPGESHAFFIPYEILIGGDGSQNELIGRVIDARPGQKLQLKVRAHNGSERERKDSEAEPESGVITFTVADAKAATLKTRNLNTKVDPD